MTTALVTGSAGLVGSACVSALIERGYAVVGIDNDSRSAYFGNAASTMVTQAALRDRYPDSYAHESIDITNREAVWQVIRGYRPGVVIHAAAQPSHDWAAKDPYRDFDVNAVGTLNIFESLRRADIDASVIYVSTNKVYGDRPNRDIAVHRVGDRYEVDEDGPYWEGIDQRFSIDQSTHSLFGVSKLAGDVIAQEYGRYFGMRVGIFRCGCLTGAAHAGAEQHGFLSYLARAIATETPYTIYGYDGLQVRDNLHAADLAAAFMHYLDDPLPAASVWNMGGGRDNSCSVLEAIAMIERATGVAATVLTGPERMGDHRWWISDTRPFARAYPAWTQAWSLNDIIEELTERWQTRAN